MPRHAIGDRPMTATERSARRRERNASYTCKLENVIRDLLLMAEKGTVDSDYVKEKCRFVVESENP